MRKPGTHESYDSTFDGRAVKRHETRTLTQIYPANTTVTEMTEYYVRSSVVGGRIMTELKSDGTKKLTNVFSGGGILAEQRDGSVQWRHQDIVTGSYKKILVDGSEAFSDNPPSTAEFEPLGGIVPQEDPNPEQPDYSPFPESNRWGGNVRHAETGCAWDGVPVFCSALVDILRSYEISRIEVNIRAPGGYDLAQRLDGAFKIKRTIEKGGVTVCDENGNNCGKTETGTRYHYELIESPIALQTGRPAPLTDEENDNLDTRIKLLVDEKLSRGDCREFLDKLGADTYTKLIDTLKNRGLRYSVERSTDITVEQAGLLPPYARRNLTILADKKHTKDSQKRQGYQNQLDSLDYSVSKWARRRSNPVHAVLGNIGGQDVIFYASFKKITTIVHENLHISTGLKGCPSRECFGVKEFGWKTVSRR